MNPQAVAPAQDSDSLLVERAQAGDQKAYGLLVLKYQRRIQRHTRTTRALLSTA